MLRWVSVAVILTAAVPVGAQDATIERTCVGCHNDRMRSGGLSLATFDVASAAEHPAVTEKIIRKLRAGLMPPAGVRRDETALAALATTLEREADAHGASAPPGRRTFQRLNRTEY